jgi:hypothetical protein
LAFSPFSSPLSSFPQPFYYPPAPCGHIVLHAMLLIVFDITLEPLHMPFAIFDLYK